MSAIRMFRQPDRNSQLPFMKIAFFIPHFTEGGLERSTLRLAEEIVNCGGEALLITLNATGKMVKMWPDADGLRVLNRRSTFTSIPALSRVIRLEKIDALISAQDHANIAAVLSRTLSGRKIPLILTERSFLHGSRKTRGLFRHIVLSRLMLCAYPKADAIVANSKDGARVVESYMGWSERRVKTIYNPTINHSIEKLQAEETDDPWFESNEVPVIMGMGRLDENKDFATLIRAFTRVRVVTECRLVIFGDGPLRGALAGLAVELGVAKHVRLEPFVENPFQFLSRSELFVLSSQTEGLPNALIEAQACGVPTVSTDCPTGPREILEDGESGALVPVGDHEAMAEQIVAILSDDNLARRYVDSANSGLDRFSPSECYSQYAALIAQIRAGEYRI